VESATVGSTVESVTVASTVESATVESATMESATVESATVESATVESATVESATVTQAEAVNSVTPSEETTAVTESTPEATETVNPLADGEFAGNMSSDPDERHFCDDLKERNHEIILENIGSLTCSEGEELRIFLSIQNNKQYITIRDTCILYSDFKDIINSFDSMLKVDEDEKKCLQKPEMQMMCVLDLSLIFFAAVTYVYFFTQLPA
jgi:hypothetical protein